MKTKLGNIIGIVSLALVIMGAGLHNEALVLISGCIFGVAAVALIVASVLITHKQAETNSGRETK